MKNPLGPGADFPTTEKLARDIESELSRRWNTYDKTRRELVTLFARRAREGWFDDYKSQLAFPISQLVRTAIHLELDDVAQAARDGKYDATPAEAARWAASVDGQDTFRLFGMGS